MVIPNNKMAASADAGLFQLVADQLFGLTTIAMKVS